MERFSERESALLSYSPQRSFENASSSNSDVDFNDVFGGPPRRSSTHETSSSRGSWSGLSEKPVFGEESVNRRRGGFFDDIFRGDENYSSPRRADKDPSCSTPGSRLLSPVRTLPMPPRADPFGNSLPAQFSLPAKLTKSMDLPVFSSSSRSPHKYRDSTSNGIIHPRSPNAPLSVLSTQAVHVQDDLKNDVRSSYRQSPLSNEFSRRSDESSYRTKSNETEVGGNLKEESKIAEAPRNFSSQFHFSIYKWAGVGIPLLMPLRGGSKSKEKVTLTRCSSYNGRVENNSIDSELLSANKHDDIPVSNESIFEGNAQDKLSTQIRSESSQFVEKVAFTNSESKSLNTEQCTIESVLGGSILSDKIEEKNPCSMPEISLSEEHEKLNSMSTEEHQKLELKPLRSLLHDEIEGQGNEEATGKAEGKENVVKMTKASHKNVSASKNVKNLYTKRTNSNKTEVNDTRLKSTPVDSGESVNKGGVRGKVRDFVKIFNQEASSRPKINVETRSQSTRWKFSGMNGADYEDIVSTMGMDKKTQSPNVTKTLDTSFMLDELVEQFEKQHSGVKTTVHESSDNSAGQKGASSFSDSQHCGSKVAVENLDDLFQEDFLVKEITHDQDNHPQTVEDYEAIQVLDAKIQHWSNGKKGNIRSLLSTLQYVLWPGSGWKPVPLVDIIEGNAVKRAYQKALLRLHPDKLQQKGAASHQKYIAEKVFDILQEAWDHFNSLGSL